MGSHVLIERVLLREVCQLLVASFSPENCQYPLANRCDFFTFEKLACRVGKSPQRVRPLVCDRKYSKAPILVLSPLRMQHFISAMVDFSHELLAGTPGLAIGQRGKAVKPRNCLEKDSGGSETWGGGLGGSRRCRATV